MKHLHNNIVAVVISTLIVLVFCEEDTEHCAYSVAGRIYDVTSLVSDTDYFVRDGATGNEYYLNFCKKLVHTQCPNLGDTNEACQHAVSIDEYFSLGSSHAIASPIDPNDLSLGIKLNYTDGSLCQGHNIERSSTVYLECGSDTKLFYDAFEPVETPCHYILSFQHSIFCDGVIPSKSASSNKGMSATEVFLTTLLSLLGFLTLVGFGVTGALLTLIFVGTIIGMVLLIIIMVVLATASGCTCFSCIKWKRSMKYRRFEDDSTAT